MNIYGRPSLLQELRSSGSMRLTEVKGTREQQLGSSSKNLRDVMEEKGESAEV